MAMRAAAQRRWAAHSSPAPARPQLRPVGVDPLEWTTPEAERASLAQVNRRDLRSKLLLALADMLALGAALALLPFMGQTIRVGAPVLAAIPAIVVAAKLVGLYDRDELVLHRSTLDELPALARLATFFALAFAVFGRGLVGHPLNPGPTFGFGVALFGALASAREVARLVTRATTPAERCLFIGDERSARRFRRKLEHGGGVKATVVARLDLEEALPWGGTGHAPGDLDHLRNFLLELRVHRVVLAPHTPSGQESGDLIRTLKAVGVPVTILPALFEAVGSSVVFDDVHGMTVLGVRRFELSRSSRVIKRAFDLVGAGVITVLVAPLLALIAVLIKLDSPGPVLFRQERVGHGGRTFRIFKFRTMVADAEARKAELQRLNQAAEGFFKIDHDPRVTRVGRLLRKSSLDELPQLLNVLRGEMSLVGPRPLIAEEDQRIEGWQRRRLDLTPGMTGHWQILGSSRVPLEEMVAIDYLYVANWSLWSDIRLLLKTVPYVLGAESR